MTTNKHQGRDVIGPKVPQRPPAPKRLTSDEAERNANKLIATFAPIAAKAIPDCPECGQVWIAHPLLGAEGPRIRVICQHQAADADARDARHARENRYNALLAKYGKAFPSRVHSGVRLGDVDANPAKAEARTAARRYVETFEERKAKGDGLFFIGDSGTGKSFLASAIAAELEARHHFTTFAVASDMLAILRDKGQGELFMAMVEASDLVVLDDLGADAPSEFGMMGLFRLLDLCYRTKKPLIVTSNMGSADLEAHYSRCLQNWGVPAGEAYTNVKRNMSRLREMCRSFAFIGDDQRAEKRHDWAEDLADD